jgi:CubicO group peptidase (beta-lactamase class C family)
MRTPLLRYLLLTIAIFLYTALASQTTIEALRAKMYAKTLSATQSIQSIERKRDSLYYNPKSNIEKLSLEELGETISAKAKIYSFNGEVIVSQNNRILSYSSLGYANPQNRERLEMGYRFQLASVSKQFTAVAILELVAKGKLMLDDSFSQYFPAFKFHAITIEHLLTHRAGLPDYFWYLENTWKSDMGPKNEDIIPLINRYISATDFVPGTESVYSNTGYVLLALLVEHITGVPFRDYMSKQYFKPLNMTKTGFVRGGLSLTGYEIDAISKLYIPIQPSLSNAILGDKGIYTTAWDLNQWFIALKRGRILSQKWVDLMFYPEDFEQTAKSFGMGFKLEWSKFGLLKVYHNGLWEGFRNGIAYFPKKDLQIIVLSHTSVKAKNIFEEQVHEAALKAVQKLPPIKPKEIPGR